MRAKQGAVMAQVLRSLEETLLRLRSNRATRNIVSTFTKKEKGHDLLAEDHFKAQAPQQVN